MQEARPPHVDHPPHGIAATAVIATAGTCRPLLLLPLPSPPPLFPRLVDCCFCPRRRCRPPPSTATAATIPGKWPTLPPPLPPPLHSMREGRPPHVDQPPRGLAAAAVITAAADDAVATPPPAVVKGCWEGDTCFFTSGRFVGVCGVKRPWRWRGSGADGTGDRGVVVAKRWVQILAQSARRLRRYGSRRRRLGGGVLSRGGCGLFGRALLRMAILVYVEMYCKKRW